MQKLAFKAMGSQILIALDTDDTKILDVAWSAQEWFSEWESIFSRFDLESELSIINRSREMPVHVSNHLLEVLKLANGIQRYSDGLVNPLVLPAIVNAGYNVSFEQIDKDMRGFLDPDNPPPISYGINVSIDSENHTVAIPTGYGLDLGGIVKGWAAHQTMRKLRKYAPVLVDAGGDIAISGPRQNREGWLIGIANPFSPTMNIDLLLLRGGGIATSGRDYRRWKMSDTWAHHIIDPRSSLPAETDLISVTVSARNVMKAEAAAKTAMILGSKNAGAWLNQKQNLDYLLVLENGDLIQSKGYSELIWIKI